LQLEINHHRRVNRSIDFVGDAGVHEVGRPDVLHAIAVMDVAGDVNPVPKLEMTPQRVTMDGLTPKPWTFLLIA